MINFRYLNLTKIEVFIETASKHTSHVYLDHISISYNMSDTTIS